MSLALAVFHADGAGGVPAAVRSALGLASGDFVDVVAGKRAMTLRVTPEVGLKAVQANWATVGARAFLYLDDAANARAQLLACASDFTGGQTGLVIGVNTAERDASLVPIRDFGRLGSPIASRTYSRRIIDGRAMTEPAIACERVTGSLTFDNVWVVGGMGAGLGTFEAAAQAAICYCENTQWRGGGFLGGRGSAQLGIIGGQNHAVTGATFGTDAGTFWNGLMVTPGNIQQNEATLGALTPSDAAAWLANDNLRRWTTGTTLIGLIGDQRMARLNRVEGGTNRVTVTWSQYQTMYAELGSPIPGTDLAGIPLSEREWWVKVGNGAVVQARFISGTMAGGQAVLELPFTLSSGTHDIGWYCCLPAYRVRGVQVHGCRGWADPGSQPNGDMVTLYDADGFAITGNIGANYKDRIYGVEHVWRGVISGNVATNAGGNDIEVTFMTQDVHVTNNVAADVALVGQGCPIIDCDIECANTITDDRPASPGTWESALSGSTTIHRGRNVEMFQNVSVRGSNRVETVTSGDVCRVAVGSRPAGLTPAMPAPV